MGARDTVFLGGLRARESRRKEKGKRVREKRRGITSDAQRRPHFTELS